MKTPVSKVVPKRKISDIYMADGGIDKIPLIVTNITNKNTLCIYIYIYIYI